MMDPATVITALVNYGALGVVLAWHLWRTDQRLDRLEQALEHWARVQLLSILARHDIETSVRERAKSMLVELDGT